MLKLQGISKSFGHRLVLEDLELEVGRRDHLALIGENGGGKSTLLKIISERLEPDTGTLHRAADVRIALLEQGAFAEETPDDRRLLIRGLERLQPGLGRLWLRGLEGDTAAVDELVSRRGYESAERLIRLAGRLGLPEKRLDAPALELSGGELARFDLAVLLAAEPDLLLLDEPTNHLDLEGLRQAETLLAEHDAAFILVSHDRDFLDAVADETLELEDGGLRRYHGGYSAYRERRDAELAAAWEDFHQAKRERRKLLAGMNRRLGIVRTIEGKGGGFAGTAHANRRGSMYYDRKAAKLSKTVKVVQRRIAEIENRRLTPPKSYTLRIRPPLGPTTRSGEIAAYARDLRFAHPGGPELFAGLDFTLYRGRRLRLAGPNGSGKSTLLRLLSGELQPAGGECGLGSKVQAFHADQRTLGLPADGTVWQAVRAETTAERREIRHLLARLLFTGESIHTPVSELSGGERARLFLALICLGGANLLLLDEPTAHLDLKSIEALEEALDAYEGSLLYISHDRAFGRRLGGRVLQLAPADRSVRHDSCT
jgi:ATPase subunit of ABC transporter with duplicated ATPase domains